MIDETFFSEEVCYPDNVKKYSLSKPPIKQSNMALLFTRLLSKALLPLIRKGHKLEKINMNEHKNFNFKKPL